MPFTVTFTAPVLQSKTALMYVRAQRHPPRRGATPGPQYAYETIFPVKVDAVAGQPVSVTRGFAVPPGRYRIAIVLREAAEDVRQGERTRQTATLVKDLEVPDFWTGELAASTVILADRVETLKEPVPADELDEHPYVVGPSRIHPASGAVFSRSRELIVVFLVYNPSIGADNHFDVQVDYHVYRKDQGGQEARAGVPAERYVTRTNPQRFNPSLMGPQFDPSAGTPILAGQGILLSEFEPGDYRLGITVTDLLSRKTVSRDVAFTVAGS